MQHQPLRSFSLRTLLVISIGFLISSFSSFKGGDVFEVYLNDKRIIQQVVHMDPKGVKTFSLDKSAKQDKVRVMYSHCGKVGTARVITITNEAKKPLKSWKYADETTKIIDCKAAELLSLVKENSKATLNLVYSSTELPEGKVLASILVNKTASEIGRLK